MSRTLEAFGRARERAGAPSPAWVVAPPLVHIPVLVTVALAVRGLAASGGHGLGHGGALWFPDLTLPAVDFVQLTAPMGVAGCILPFASAGLFFANTQLSLGHANPAAGGWPLLWRTALEWASVAVLAVGVQLPQGALCWWVGSGLFTSAQILGLRQPSVRRALSLPVAGEEAGVAARRRSPDASGAAPAGVARVPGALDPRMRSWTDAEAGEGGGGGGSGGGGSSSAGYALREAAELKAKGEVDAAAKRLRRALESDPEDFALNFVLGRLSAERGKWEKAAKYYSRAAVTAGEGHPSERANALFGAGVALGRLNREGEALRSLESAGAANPGHLGAWLAAASLHKKRGDLTAALAALRQAAAVDASVEERYIRRLEAEIAAGGDRGATKT